MKEVSGQGQDVLWPIRCEGADSENNIASGVNSFCDVVSIKIRIVDDPKLFCVGVGRQRLR